MMTVLIRRPQSYREESGKGLCLLLQQGKMKSIRKNLVWKAAGVILALVIAIATTAVGEGTSWSCPDCGRTNQGNYCVYCGHAAPWIGNGSGNGRYSKSDFSTIGRTVTFGRYEQDNRSSNGSERIEWIVLDVKDGKCLLLSKYGLDAKRYNETRASTTWENCTLRSWLNGFFLHNAFDAEEQSAIALSQLDNSYGAGISFWNTTGGRDTWDQVFLLSCAEAQKYYYVEADQRECAQSRVVPTAYAKAHGAYVSKSYIAESGRGAGWWWLRSPGKNQYEAARIHRGGWIGFNDVDVGDACVRPAIWVDLNSAVF